MTFNDFQRELQRRNIDPQVAYMLALTYERVIEMAKQIDEMAKIILQVVATTNDVVELQHFGGERLKEMLKDKDREHALVESVANDPMEGEK